MCPLNFPGAGFHGFCLSNSKVNIGGVSIKPWIEEDGGSLVPNENKNESSSITANKDWGSDYYSAYLGNIHKPNKK